VHIVSLLNLWQEEWLLREKVRFDAPKKQIFINPEVDKISVKADLYSAWKRWVQFHNNAGYAQAFRTIGGDSIGGGRYAGDMYFLMNGWQIVLDHFVQIDGVLYHDDEIDPYVLNPGGGVMATVSALVTTVPTLVPVVTGDVSDIPAALDDIGAKTDNMVAKVDAQANTVTTIDTRTAAQSVQLGRIETTANSIAIDVGNIPADTVAEMDANSTALANIQTGVDEANTSLDQLSQTTGLSDSQATMLLEMYELLGLDPAKPLVVSKTARTAGSINQTIISNATTETTTVSRNP
jgi:hypothetical protein